MWSELCAQECVNTCYSLNWHKHSADVFTATKASNNSMKIAFCCQWDFMPQKAAFKNQSFYTPMNDFHGICQKKWDIRWTRTLKLNSLKILSRVPHHCALVAIAAPCNCRLILFEEDYLQCIQWSENWKSQIFFKRMNPHTNSDMQGHRFSMQIFSGPVLPTLRFFVWLWMSS